MKKILTALMLALMAATFGHADDLAIYGTVSTGALEPNVMIIFDTSGSMETDDVPKDAYVKTTTYSGSYSKDAVYERKWNNSAGKYEWPLFVNNVSSILCETVKNSLLDAGWAVGKVRSNLKCGGSDDPRYLRLGNYLNYLPAWSEGDDDDRFRRRIDVAKEVLTTLIDQTTGVRFGLMVFNNNQGGRVVAPCGTDKATLKARIAAATASGWTPLAETLAEAGLYFAGKPSWFNSGVSYTSPMQERCQKNYIIIMTDGEPTKDRDSRLYSAAYINGDVIGDYDGDHGGGLEFDTYPSDGSDYLDDVAKYLYVNDCNPSLGTGTAFEKQNIVTFTIGFQVSHRLLYDTAVNGGGDYFTAENYASLSEAFTQIMSSISDKNASFVAPAVPASDLNNAFAGRRTYLGFFKPQQSGRWIGNIKRYAVDADGTLRDALGNPAVDANGMIRDEARSFWTTTGDDGPAVEKGGAAEALDRLMASGETRKLYTWTGTAPLLTDAANAFATANTAITNAALGVASDAERQALFATVLGGRFGDVIHSEPAIVSYADADGIPATNDPKTAIFVGANDGLLHAIDDADGAELWSFVPPEHLGRLRRLTDADHDYFVDGSPVVYERSGQKILVVGSRRGGEHYSALDVTNLYAPRFLYRIGPNILDPNPLNVPDTDAYERLGQSWVRPERAAIATGSSVTTVGCSVQVTAAKADVLVMAGGYDTNQDLPTPSASDGVGRAVFAANLVTGQPLSNLRFSPATHPALGMTHSVVDLSVLDHDDDGIASRIYFGDLGGNLFALKDDENQNFTVCGQTVVQSVVDGSWTGRKLFNASADGVRRKILYAPDAVPGQMAGGLGEHLFFGTGDRENPLETTVVNRFYALKNDWSAGSTLTESDLVDVTDDLIQLGTEAEKTQVQSNLDAKKGWYIRLENPGEKVVATPRVYGGVVYFTTFTPSAGLGPSTSDPCAGSTARGVARIYALNWKNGASAHDFALAAETDRSGKTVSLGKTDRSTIIGTAIPSAPFVGILGGVSRLFAGVEGGVVNLPTIPTPDMHRFFWNRIH